jgi:hypothetical protein
MCPACVASAGVVVGGVVSTGGVTAFITRLLRKKKTHNPKVKEK